MAAPSYWTFNFSYVVDTDTYDATSGIFTLLMESAEYFQPSTVKSSTAGEEVTGALSSGENGFIIQSPEDTFVYIGKVAGQNAIFVDVGNGEYYVYSETALNLATNYTRVVENYSYVYCLLSGTKIETSRGIVNVEDIFAGDLVRNSSGGYSPVRWVGVQTLSPLFSGKASWPVKISQGALGENAPNQDLYVSQDHAIFLQGLLVCAEALVNGTTITIEKPTVSSIKYYGLDLGPATIHPVHNLPVGSLGAVPREYFDNYQQWLDSGHELIDEPLMFPRVKSASQLPDQVKRGISA